jgi:glycosyltransferase involved in cell wall biosynthesis
MTPTFSIVIATKDRAALLDGALASLRAQAGAPPTEIIVVDNNSTDGTRAVAERHGVTYLFEPVPNRGKARNRGITAARGSFVLFIDDDVVLPPFFVAAHAAAHADTSRERVVAGPIINVPSPEVRPHPSALNFSNAFLCTCNASVPKAALDAVGGFDEAFNLYGWEDTELGLRLREHGVEHGFAWEAYLWHIKPPATETLEVLLAKTTEKARMAARLVRKAPTRRTRLATGAYGFNLVLGRILGPRYAQPLFAGLATSARVPAPIAAFARMRLLDSVYVDVLTRSLAEERDR